MKTLKNILIKYFKLSQLSNKIVLILSSYLH
jgi:hypothetical protein